VLPHERCVCGIATVVAAAVPDVVNAGFPAALVADVVDWRGRVASPAIRRWLMSDAPVYVARPGAGCVPRNLMAKLNVSTRGHAAVNALKNGLVTP